MNKKNSINFGKYKGMTVNWIKNNDKSYYEWGCKNIPDVFKPKSKNKIAEINNNDTILNYQHKPDDIKWDASYPKDMSDRLWKWFKNI